MNGSADGEARSTAGGTFARSGGWVVVVAIALATFAFGWRVVWELRHHGPRPVGDGRHVASYGFPLTPLLVPPDFLVASGIPKDGRLALVDPPSWTTGQADAATTRYHKFLVPDDRVIGVVVGEAARAYPLRLLVWHEVVNDVLGGVPILVTYSPLCDGAAVFRRAGSEGTATFGVSGLLYDSCLVMYDRQPAAQQESLWGQLEMRAIAGPAAARRVALEPLPISVEPWADWRGRHPATTVLAPDPRFAEQYASDPFASYFGNDLLQFPVAPLPSPSPWPLKTPVIAIGQLGRWTAFAAPVAAELAAAHRTPGGEAGECWGALSYRSNPTTLAVEASRLPTGDAVVYASSFAWYAVQRDDTTWVHGDGSLGANMTR